MDLFQAIFKIIARFENAYAKALHKMQEEKTIESVYVPGDDTNALRLIGRNLLSLHKYGYRLSQLLGEGGFGKVFQSDKEDNVRGEVVAVKVVVKSVKDNLTVTDIVDFENETIFSSLLDKSKIPCSVEIYDFEPGISVSVIVMKKYDGGDLDDLIKIALGPKKRQVKHLPRAMHPFVLKCLRLSIITAHEAHKLGIYHRDLKPSNILVDGQLPGTLKKKREEMEEKLYDELTDEDWGKLWNKKVEEALEEDDGKTTIIHADYGW